MGKAIKNSQMQSLWKSRMQLNYGVPSLQLLKGKGIEVWDVEGRKYLDFLGGIATNILGHNHKRIVAAISEQSKTLSHVSNFSALEPGLELAAELIEMTG